RCVAGRQVEETKLFVWYTGCPAIRRCNRIAFAVRGQAGSVRSAHIPGPLELAGDRIECTDHARGFTSVLTVGDPATHDNLATGIGRRGGDLVVTADDLAFIVFHADGEVDIAAFAEGGAELAGLGVNSDE